MHSDQHADTNDIPDRSKFTTKSSLTYLWETLNLPLLALTSIDLSDDGTNYPSSFKIGDLAQSSIALSALTAALIHSLKTDKIPRVSIPRKHACLEFQTEKLFTIDGKAVESTWGPIGGLHATSDGYVRIHDNFPHHRDGALELLALGKDASREDVGAKVKQWNKLDLEDTAYRKGLVIYALRSYEEWDTVPHASEVSSFPILIQKLDDRGSERLPPHMPLESDRCLRGLRVLELSRVIAAPVAGKTLAAHGADVLWVTSPNLPDLPSLDRNLSRGKRTIQLDLNDTGDVEVLRRLVKDCDVFIQGYRPRGLVDKGFGPADLAALRPGLIYANMSAFGPTGPWSDRRGFDSLVQTCMGLNVSEAQHFGGDASARPMPCQALDYAAGYLLASGICAALYRKAQEGGSWQVDVSLAAVGKYLRSLGQYPGKSGFDCADPARNMEDDPFEERGSGFGLMRGLRHAAHVEGAEPGWDIMPKPLGTDKARWL